RFACTERTRHQLLTLLGPQHQLAAKHVHGLVLEVVVLQAQNVPRLHMQNLSDVLVGAGPHQLVAPRLIYPVPHLGHKPSALCAVNPGGRAMQSCTQTTRRTQPSRRSDGCPDSSITNAASPTGQASTQTRHSLPWNVTQFSGRNSSSARRYPSQPRVGTLSAPVGQARAQGMSGQATQGWSSSWRNGVPAASPAFEPAVRIACTGHTGTHAPQRVHAARNPTSGSAPGGRTERRWTIFRSVSA